MSRGSTWRKMGLKPLAIGVKRPLGNFCPKKTGDIILIVNRENAAHYTWGDLCEGWILRNGDNLLIIEERMLPFSFEERHSHSKAEQFF